MGLFGAMTASVSGLNAQGQAISVISDNLANTNTIGYKSSRSLFAQLVTSSGTSGTSYNSGGVATAVQRDQTTQGSFISSTSKTDLAISGNGFFRVADTAANGSGTSYYYTRAGSFSEDKQGFLTNPDGFYLQGWKTDSDGNILNVQNLQSVELQSVGVSAQATSEFSIDANLTSTEGINAIYSSTGTLQDALDAIVADPTKADYVTDVRVYDAQGGARDMTMAFSKRSANTWDWQLYSDGANVQGGTAGTPTRVASGELDFNTTGSLKFASGATFTAAWSGGVNPSQLTINFGDFTGGNLLNTASAGLSYPATTAPSLTTNGITNAASVNVAGNTLGAGTYTLRRVDATHVELYNATNTAPVGTDGSILISNTDPQVINFPNSGISVTTGAGFFTNVGTLADGDPIGTAGNLVIGTTTTGGVLNITSEDPTTLLPGQTYTIRKIAAGPPAQLGLFNAANTQIDTATIGDTGNREVFFSAMKLRMTVSGQFEETANTYPSTVGTFTLSNSGPLKDGLGSDGVTQLAANYDTNSINQNGFGAGTLSSITVDEDGFVSGTFTNGENKKLYKIALAVFQNPRALEAVSGSLLRTTDASGNALMKQAGSGGTGRFVSGSLEGSTTDIAGEFSNMIVAQRAFQASSKVITTVDQMLNELLQLR